jgi:probable HAF family extracellular repeat protein
MFRSKKHFAGLTVETLETRDCPSVYSIVDLLPPTGGNFSSGLGLNDEGLVVGRAAIAGMNSRPSVWQIGTEKTSPGTFLPLLTGHNGGHASDVNNNGMIAGESTVVGGSTSRAVVWTGSGPYVSHDLGALAGFNYSEAKALSEPDSSDVTWVVGDSKGGGSTALATVWRIDAFGNVLSTIGLEPTTVNSRASDVRMIDPSIHEPGDEYILVTGEVELPSAVKPAVIWKLNLSGSVQNRTDLGTLGGTASWGYGINSSGHVAGQSKPASGSALGFIHKDGVMASLGTITNGGSQAQALNDSDVVVGHSTILSKSGTYQSSKAFVWQNGTMFDLRSQLGSVDKSNWSYLFGALDVNAVGQIAGNGRVGKGQASQEHGFLMTPAALHADTFGTGDDAVSLSLDQVQPLLTEALSRLQANGADTSALYGIDIRIADLGGTTLGLASGNTIWLDDNAAGWGWFVDPTPGDDREFYLPGDQGEQDRMDLLTVLEHELGHLLGYDHEEGGVMGEALSTGTRESAFEGTESDLSGLDWFFAAQETDAVGIKKRHR